MYDFIAQSYRKHAYNNILQVISICMRSSKPQRAGDVLACAQSSQVRILQVSPKPRMPSEDLLGPGTARTLPRAHPPASWPKAGCPPPGSSRRPPLSLALTPHCRGRAVGRGTSRCPSPPSHPATPFFFYDSTRVLNFHDPSVASAKPLSGEDGALEGPLQARGFGRLFQDASCSAEGILGPSFSLFTKSDIYICTYSFIYYIFTYFFLYLRFHE